MSCDAPPRTRRTCNAFPYGYLRSCVSVGNLEFGGQLTPRRFFEPPPKDVPVDVVLSVAQLSHKYEVQHLRHRSILHIERNYSMDMDTFISRSLGTRDGKFQDPWFLGLETLLDIIVTATYINALWVLPAAYYHCSDMTPSHTLRDTSSWNSPQRATVLRNIMVGTINLEIMDVALGDLLGTPPCPECLHREKCALDKLETAQVCRLSITERKPASRKAHTLVSWWNRKWLKEGCCVGLCSPCSSACMSAYESARGDYWDKIPSAFNLPSWKELKLLRESDFSE